VHAHFLETKEAYTDEKGVSKARTNVKCNHCNKRFVLRNLQQLICHLAAPNTGMGYESACTSVPAAVCMHFADRIARYEEDKAAKASKEKSRIASEALELDVKKRAKMQAGITEAFAASSVCLV